MSDKLASTFSYVGGKKNGYFMIYNYEKLYLVSK